VEVEREQGFEPNLEVRQTKAVCPHCEKSYLIFLKDLPEEINRFICKSCDQDFWIRRVEVEEGVPVIGIPGEELLGKEKEKCPKCGQAVESLEKECGGCGVVGAKYLALREESPYLKVNPELKALWKRVLNNYDDEHVHHEFLSQCLKEKQLRYASLQYKQLREAVGDDRLLRTMIGKIQNLSTLEIEAKAQGQKLSPTEKKSYFRFLRWEAFLAGLGMFCVLSGLATPFARNLISLGIVLMIFPLLIAFLLRRG
jgi:hypothetical protein